MGCAMNAAVAPVTASATVLTEGSAKPPDAGPSVDATKPSSGASARSAAMTTTERSLRACFLMENAVTGLARIEPALRAGAMRPWRWTEEDGEEHESVVDKSSDPVEKNQTLKPEAPVGCRITAGLATCDARDVVGALTWAVVRVEQAKLAMCAVSLGVCLRSRRGQ